MMMFLREIRRLLKGMIDGPDPKEPEPTLWTAQGGYPAPLGAQPPDEKIPREPDRPPNQYRRTKKRPPEPEPPGGH